MVSMCLRRLISATPVCALIFSTNAAQAQQPSGAVTLFNNVRVFDGKGTSLSEPTNQHVGWLGQRWALAVEYPDIIEQRYRAAGLLSLRRIC